MFLCCLTKLCSSRASPDAELEAPAPVATGSAEEEEAPEEQLLQLLMADSEIDGERGDGSAGASSPIHVHMAPEATPAGACSPARGGTTERLS